MYDFKDPVPVQKRLRRGLRKPLSTSEKISIVHKALVLKEMQGEIAQEYGIKLYTVSRLVNKARKHPQFLQELLTMRERAETVKDKIIRVLQELNDQHYAIGSAGEVNKILREKVNV